MRKIPIFAALMSVVLLVAPALQAKTLTIGFTTSQTGKLNADSKPQLLGFQLWRDQVNAAGGIKVGGADYQIALKYYDDQSSAGRVQQLYSRLILQDNADFLFSPYSSGLTATAAVVPYASTDQNQRPDVQGQRRPRALVHRNFRAAVAQVRPRIREKIGHRGDVFRLQISRLRHF